MKRLCTKCHLRPATVPDRNAMGRPVLKFCSVCHSSLLRSDLSNILDDHFKKIRIPPFIQHTFDLSDPREDN